MVATCSSKRTDKSVDEVARDRLDEMRRDERREHDREVSGPVALRIGVRAVVREGRLHSRAYMGQFQAAGG